MAKSLGNEIHRVRQLRGLSLNAAAKPAGVSAAYLQKLERDQVDSPSPHRLNRLAEVLGVDYSDLFSLAGYPLPNTPDRPLPGSNETVTAGTSALRRMLASEDEVNDDELEELVRYLNFMRQQQEPKSSGPNDSSD
jgi:HTH-type transcriptional regulator, competence development regulator